MTKKILLILITFAFISCGKNKSDDIYKTKGGEYASKVGNFVAAFPTEPSHTAIDNQIGLDKFQIHMYRSTLGSQKIFNVEYIDYPEHMIKSMSNGQLYNQGVANYANKMAESFNLQYQKPVEQHELDGQKFQLELNENAKSKGLDGFILGRLFRQGNRVYTITYIGIDDERAGSFVNSFRLLK
ncbi:hypothetical protein [Mesohalobacter halotolerans]|uniref:Lipoprotein n=1 Tax=Mesohalobacter halotolerans TaxID=1883405 RepID=A0A4U5TVD7_9FLAO|nr:hypothetical protein [Mesohalobacter halotolerans]TKS57208.1 hypothetical protein FCN74_01965 [Mesohalobacter halotolerans]